MLTIFTTCKRFSGPYATIQYNAIGSWAHLKPKPVILLFGTEARSLCGDNYVPVRRNRWGTPLLDDMFQKSEKVSDTPLMALVNADIILMPGFMEAVKEAAGRWDEFLLIGQRTNLAIENKIDFENLHWWAAVEEAARRHGVLEPPCGIDYFVYTRGLFKHFPGLAIGRYAWDQRLVYDVLQRGVTVVDGTHKILAIHQSHLVSVLRSDEECQRNIQMARVTTTGWTPWEGWVNQATERL